MTTKKYADKFLQYKYMRKEEPYMDIKVTEIKIIDDKHTGKPKVMMCYFSDETFTKAVCDDADRFNFEIGLNICLLKRIFGNKQYYQIQKNGEKIFKKTIDKTIKENEEKLRIKAKKAKNEERKRKRKEKHREELIEMQKEAYLRAMKEKDR